MTIHLFYDPINDIIIEFYLEPIFRLVYRKGYPLLEEIETRYFYMGEL